MPGTKKLVIVESPAKAKTIAQYLGEGYEVQASVGHIRDLIEPKNLPPELKKRSLVMPIVDLLFVRNAWRSSLRSTLTRFGVEVEGGRASRATG